MKFQLILPPPKNSEAAKRRMLMERDGGYVVGRNGKAIDPQRKRDKK